MQIKAIAARGTYSHRFDHYPEAFPMNSANYAEHLGRCYFFCSTEARDAFEASQRILHGNVAKPPAGEVQEQQSKTSGATAARANPRPNRSRTPDASFLG